MGRAFIARSINPRTFDFLWFLTTEECFLCNFLFFNNFHVSSTLRWPTSRSQWEKKSSLNMQISTIHEPSETSRNEISNLPRGPRCLATPRPDSRRAPVGRQIPGPLEKGPGISRRGRDGQCWNSLMYKRTSAWSSALSFLVRSDDECVTWPIFCTMWNFCD